MNTSNANNNNYNYGPNSPLYSTAHAHFDRPASAASSTSASTTAAVDGHHTNKLNTSISNSDNNSAALDDLLRYMSLGSLDEVRNHGSTCMQCLLLLSFFALVRHHRLHSTLHLIS